LKYIKTYPSDSRSSLRLCSRKKKTLKLQFDNRTLRYFLIFEPYYADGFFAENFYTILNLTGSKYATMQNATIGHLVRIKCAAQQFWWSTLIELQYRFQLLSSNHKFMYKYEGDAMIRYY
jgi:hypothetical protein